MEMRPEGLIVRAPYGASQTQIDAFVGANRTWIEKAKKKMEQIPAPARLLTKEEIQDLARKAAAYLHAAVLAGLNIVMVGPTGCGKTTMLTALGKCIPPGKRGRR